MIEVGQDLLDRIYEASVVPDLWPTVLKELAAFSGCKDGMLVANPHTPEARWVASGDLVAAMDEFGRDGWATRNTKAARLAPMRYPGFIRDNDIFAPEEMDNDPLYLDLLRRHGFWFSVGTMVSVPTGDLLVFDIERAYGAPPVEPEAVARLDALRPHLSRAALIAARLGLERARAMVSVLGAIGLPGVALGHGGRVLATNDQLDRLSRQVVPRALGRIALSDPAANALLQSSFDRLAVRTASSAVMSFPIPAVDEHPALIAHLLPVRRSAHDLFSGAVAILVATPLTAAQAPSEDLLHGLFDLTPAEARVARAVIEGQTLDSYAAKNRISRETARAQLKSVFVKTGTRRQAELAALLAGKGTLNARPAGPPR